VNHATRIGVVLAAGVLLAGAIGCLAQMLDRLWARFLPRFVTYAIAPNGSVDVSTDWDGPVPCLAEDGHVLRCLKFARQVR
jgi:hypothetical protein